MKKLLIVFCLLMLLTMTACGPKNSQTETAPKKEEQAEAQKAGDEKTESQADVQNPKADESTKKPETVRIGQTWVIHDQNPLDGGNPWSMTSHGITEYVYMLQKDGTLQSRYIESLNQVDDLNWSGELKKGVMFSDGTEIKAEDLCNCLNTIMKENELSNATAGKISFVSTGDYSFTATTERPTKVLKSVLAEWTNVVFKKISEDVYVFTGPFTVKALNPGSEVTLTPNKFYPGFEDRPEVTIKAFKDINALKLAFESKELDLAFGITGEVANMLKSSGHNIMDFNAAYQYFTFLNTESEILSDINVRKAINYALNRSDFIKALHGGNIPTGVFAHYFSFNGENEPIYDLAEAKKLLDDSGWIADSNGLRSKDGNTLKLDIVTYMAKPDLPIIMQVMTSQLQELGVEVNTRVVDNIQEITSSKNYEILVYAQNPAPTGEPSFFLNQFFRSDGTNNFTGYKSTIVDGLLDELGNTGEQSDIDRISKEIQTELSKDLPLLYTVDPVWHAAVSPELKNYELYGGDYFIVNSSLKLEK